MLFCLMISEEFLQLCPGGIGFVPDPFTLVIKGELEYLFVIIIIALSNSATEIRNVSKIILLVIWYDGLVSEYKCRMKVLHLYAHVVVQT